MTFTISTAQTANVPPTFLDVIPGDGHLSIHARWDNGVVVHAEPNTPTGCDPRTIRATLPIEVREDGSVVPHPEMRPEVGVVREDSLLGEEEPTRLTQPMLAGFVDRLRSALSGHEAHDAHGLTGAVIAASPRVPFTRDDCPILERSTAVQLHI